jgi:hypothetical protein
VCADVAVCADAVCADAVPVEITIPNTNTKLARTPRNPILKGVDRRISVCHFLKEEGLFCGAETLRETYIELTHTIKNKRDTPDDPRGVIT